jgi:hypothetical protein
MEVRALLWAPLQARAPGVPALGAGHASCWCGEIERGIFGLLSIPHIAAPAQTASD